MRKKGKKKSVKVGERESDREVSIDAILKTDDRPIERLLGRYLTQFSNSVIYQEITYFSLRIWDIPETECPPNISSVLLYFPLSLQLE